MSANVSLINTGTGYQTVAFGDTLYLSKIKEDQACADEFSCSEPSLSGRSNLVIRALNLLRDKTGTNQFFQVTSF
jgi:4-diphosphocytidyl-2C-methyl-D-erythritol kinase